MTAIGTTIATPSQSSSFDRRLEGIGWALFLIMIGALCLLPDGFAPEGTWLAGAGLIMVGMNVTRHLKGMRISAFTTVLGLVALALGLAAVAGVALPILPTLLVAIGVEILYNLITRR